MLRPRIHNVTALLLVCGVVCVRIRLEATSGTASAVLNRLDAYDFCRNRLLVEGSGGSARSGTAFTSVAVAPLLLADAVAVT